MRQPGRHLVIVGCTASGKSTVALEVARRRRAADRPTEIVSCDAMAVYSGMDIGTATPSPDSLAAVPHHLVSVVDPSEEYSVSHFRDAVDRVLDDIESRGADAVLVGGTGLYVRAVTDGLVLPPRYPEVAAELEAEPDTDLLLARLTALDPLAASRIPPGNRRRIVRALEVTLGSGRPFSASGPGLDVYGPTPFVLTGLRVPRDVIAARIRARFDAQMDAGFLDEVRSLAARPGSLSRTAREALGYRDPLAYLRGACTLAEALDTAVVRTRRFAVRQERWFGRDPRIRWFDPSSPSTPGPAAVAAAVDDLWSELDGAATGSTASVDRAARPGPA
jgi:tRNA dimethylallyltransferase